MTNLEFSPWPDFSRAEADAAACVLLSNKVNYWTGQEGRQFEKEFAAWANTQYAIATSNGTTALDLALKALNIRQGDEVITTPRTFLASVSSIVSAGAKPVFADVDLNSQNITAKTIAASITSATKAIIVVHLAGMPAEMDAIMQLAEQHNLFVIEDCAQAHGAMYRGQSVGSIGHIGAWSFCQDKIMTTGGEGGMVTTNDKALWSTMWSYKDHGKSWEAVYQREHPPGFRWLHDSFGTNWRLTEMQSAIGRIQLTKMAKWAEKRQENCHAIWNTCREFEALRVPEIPEHIQHAGYKCYVFVEPEKLRADWNRDRIMAAINEQGVPCFSGSCSEVYLEKAFDNTGWRPKTPLPNARELGETSLMFLVHPTLTRDNIATTCNAIRTVMQQASALKSASGFS